MNKKIVLSITYCKYSYYSYYSYLLLHTHYFIYYILL